MKRSRLKLLFCLLIVVLIAACRNDEPPPSPTAGPSSVDTPVDTPAATATPAAARGEEPAADAADQETAAETPAPAEERGIVYSIPFAVQPDGFGFRNYGPGYPEGDFTIAELRELFGDGVCSRVEEGGETCIPSAEAQQWIDDRNADMRAGHCIGFTVTSYRFAEGELRPADFSPAADAPFDLAQESPIMRNIALNGSLYWVKSVWSNEVSGAPRDIIDALIALGEPVDLSIFLPGLVGGHSLLAYGVEEVGPGQFHILVYDNNYPGEQLYVEVDYETDTWHYDQGAVNPNQTAVPYEGDATTETLRFIPLAAYDGAVCPFCPAEVEEDGEGDDEEAITLVSFLGQGEMLIETALGAIGSVAGEIINEIPGARLILLRGQLAADGVPDVALPAGVDYTVEFKGLERVSGMSPGLSLVVDHLAPAAENNRLSVAPDGRNIEFRAGGDQSPSLSVTLRQADASFKATLLGVDFTDGQTVTMGAPESGEGLELRSEDLDVADATLLITRLTDEDEAIFATTALDIKDGGGVTLAIDKWDGSGSIDLLKDDNGDGRYDDPPTDLSNEPLNEVLQDSDIDDIGDIIDTLSPFLGSRGLESILASLAEQELSGEEIGRILLPFQLTDEQLVEIIPPLDLPVPDVGELLFALRLEPERVDTVRTGLELEEADDAQLKDYYDNLVLYHQIILDWNFLNTDDLAQLIALLGERQLSAGQLVELLPRMGLSTDEIEYVLGGLQLSTADLAAIVGELGVNLPPTHTPTPAPTVTQTITITATAGTPVSGTATLTPTPTGTITATVAAGGTPAGTPTPASYPGALPTPTGTPDPYPYPGPAPSPTGSPGAYPGGPSPTPAFDSTAFCVGDDLRILPEEETWPAGTVIEIWANEELLFTGEIPPEDEEPLVVTLPGPDTWEMLYIAAEGDPERVPFRVISCPVVEE